MKPAPFEIFPAEAHPDGRHWVYLMQTNDREPAEHERRALVMRHAPELLNELKAATELLLQLCDHGREGTPLPTQATARHVALDAWNVIELAEGRKTEGTRYYPPPEDG